MAKLQDQSGSKSQKNTLHAEPPRSNFVTVRKWYLSHQFALQIGSHAQNEFGGANLRTRIFLCQIACLGTRSRLSPNWQSVLSFRTILRSSPNYTDMLSAQSEFRKFDISSTESPTDCAICSGERTFILRYSLQPQPLSAALLRQTPYAAGA